MKILICEQFFTMRRKTMIKTKYLLASLLLVAALMISNALVWAVPTLSLQPSTTTPLVGSSFDVTVNISSVTDLFAFQFDILFDPTILSATAITEGSFLPSGGTTFFIPGTIDNTAGTIVLTADSLIALAGVSGDGDLATFTFSALAKGTSALSLANVELLDSELLNIEFASSGTSVSPGQVSTVPEANSAILLSLGVLAMFVWRRTQESSGV
jgi:general secretion pathway protein D